MVRIVQASRVQIKRRSSDGREDYFIYLSKKYKELWKLVKERNIPIIVRIDIPDDLLMITPEK